MPTTHIVREAVEALVERAQREIDEGLLPSCQLALALDGEVPGMLDRLDDAQRVFGRTEPDLKALTLKASEYVHRQLRFTPFPGEPIGALIEQAGDDLFMFSSDFPHPEGGTDPLAKFEAALAATDETARERFYTTNYVELMALSATAGATS